MCRVLKAASVKNIFYKSTVLVGNDLDLPHEYKITFYPQKGIQLSLRDIV